MPHYGVIETSRVLSTVGGPAPTELHRRTGHHHRVIKGRRREKKKKMKPAASRQSPDPLVTPGIKIEPEHQTQENQNPNNLKIELLNYILGSKIQNPNTFWVFSGSN
jgi:hypothetical protein